VLSIETEGAGAGEGGGVATTEAAGRAIKARATAKPTASPATEARSDHSNGVKL